MNKKETKRFEILYDRYLKNLKLQGKSGATISAYSSAVRRLTEHFCPNWYLRIGFRLDKWVFCCD